MSTAFITHPDCLKHDMGDLHPEAPARLTAIHDHLIAQGIDMYFTHYEAPLATMEQLMLVHPAAHIKKIKEAAPAFGIAHLDPDTAMNPFTWQAALRSAGAGIMAVDLLMDKKAENAFCAVRPPGHHCEREAPMGFCFFNNISIAAYHALEHHKLERVAIIDFDVHHGNGTENICAGDDRILMCSIFQHPFYPYSGTDHPAANMVNVPLPGGSGGEELQQAVLESWIPRLEAFKPQMLFISAGFDAHYEDDMGGMKFFEKDYAWVTTQLRGVAARHANNRIVSMLEGGYVMSALARSVAAHLRALAEI